MNVRKGSERVKGVSSNNTIQYHSHPFTGVQHGAMVTVHSALSYYK
jgi:hypothetical protein